MKYYITLCKNINFIFYFFLKSTFNITPVKQTDLSCFMDNFYLVDSAAIDNARAAFFKILFVFLPLLPVNDVVRLQVPCVFLSPTFTKFSSCSQSLSTSLLLSLCLSVSHQ